MQKQAYARGVVPSELWGSAKQRATTRIEHTYPLSNVRVVKWLAEDGLWYVQWDRSQAVEWAR